MTTQKGIFHNFVCNVCNGKSWNRAGSCRSCGGDVCHKCFDSYKENDKIYLNQCCEEPEWKDETYY